MGKRMTEREAQRAARQQSEEAGGAPGMAGADSAAEMEVTRGGSGAGDNGSPLLLLVDGHSLAFRSFYAFAKGGDGGLSTKAGVPTSVTYGFLKSLLDNCRGLAPNGVVIAFDTAEPTFRHEADATYKAHRDETPEAFFADLENLQAILRDEIGRAHV